MTSIYDIPYKDIKIFLDANGETFKNKDDAYKITIDLLKDKKAIGHTTSIIEWMMAHNLMINKINIPYYNISDIDNMSQSDINDLAKLLKMKGNNIKNIKNILRYLHKLQNEEEFLVKDINTSILDTLTQLELQDIDVSKLKYKSVINLLKTHRNKKVIRKFIFDNLEKIIIYNSLELGSSSDILLDGLLERITIYNKNIIIEIIMDNETQLFKHYDNEGKNEIIKEAKENYGDQGGEVYISEMDDLVNFTFDLINANEIILAKKVFDIVNKLHYFRGRYYGRSYSYNYDLVDMSIIGESSVLKNIIKFMGEDEFIKNYSLIIKYRFQFVDDDKYIAKFLENLVKLEKYDLLLKIIQLYIDENYSNKGKMIDKMLPNIKKAIQSKNDNLIIKYIGDIYL